MAALNLADVAQLLAVRRAVPDHVRVSALSCCCATSHNNDGSDVGDNEDCDVG